MTPKHHGQIRVIFLQVMMILQACDGKNTVIWNINNIVLLVISCSGMNKRLIILRQLQKSFKILSCQLDYPLSLLDSYVGG